MTITATKVQENQRLQFLPSMFGSAMIRAEGLLFKYASTLAPDQYDGGYWEFYKTSNGSGYAAPTTPERYTVSVQGNGYEGEMSNDAAGIVFTLFVINQLAHEISARGLHDQAEKLSDKYHALRQYVGQHPEAKEIFAAID